MTLLYENNAAGTLADPITNSQLTITLNAGQAPLFPNPAPPDEFYATLTDAATQTNVEIVLVTQVSGNVFTIAPGGRGQDGTTAQSWLAEDIISQRAVAAEYRQWQGIVPIGGIIMWSGAATAIPENWALCNGSGGTPNLQDRFVIGAGDMYAVGETGGAANATLSIANLPPHSHVAVVNDEGHFHSIALGEATVGLANGSAAISTSTTGPSDTNPNVTGITVTTENTGSGAAVAILPPYYALCFIMRTS